MAYKAIREQYRKNGAIPRRLSREQQGPLLGTKKEVVVKPAFYTNKFVVASVLGALLLSAFGGILWSLDVRITENNRYRAMIEKSTTTSNPSATKEPLEIVPVHTKVQSLINLDP